MRDLRQLAARAPARLAVPSPHLVAASACVGLGLALAARQTSASLAAAAGLLAAVAPLAGRRRTALLALAFLLAGVWWGGVRLAELDRSLLADEIGRSALARVELTGPARRGLFAVRVPVRVVRFGRTELSERARLDLPLERSPPPGAVLELVVTVAAPRGPDDADGFDEAAYLRRQGVHVVLRGDSYRVVGRRSGLGGVADGLRRAVTRSLSHAPAGERRAVLAGVVLGEDEGLEEALRERFRASGLYHLLAVSGQNVAYVVAGTILLAWALRLPRWAGELGALGTVGAYVLAVGWQPSVVRAGVAGVLASLAWLASRPRDRWYFLLVGAAVLLAWNPYSLLEPGFQLSFSAVAAIFVLVPRIERRLEGYPLPSKLATVVSVSAACGLVTAPVLWLHFGAVPVYSVAANALAAPVVAPLLGLALAAAALDPVLPAAAAALVWVDAWLAAYLAFCARLVGGLPHAQVDSPAGLALLAAVLGLGALFLLLPGPGSRRAGIVATLALALAVAWRSFPGEEPLPPPDGLRLTMLDVGQGDAILLQVPEGAVLVDQGPPEADVAARLRRLGVRSLAALVLTHPQRDHVGGAADVLERLPVTAVLDPLIPAPSPDQEAALEAAEEHGVPVVEARAGQGFRVGGLRMRVLWPDGPAPPGADPNDSAIVLLASYGRVDVLLTADAEGNVTVPLRPPDVEILKVAHHGSGDPRLPDLLRLVRPEIALVSVGSDNRYGHPDPATIASLEAFPGLALYRSDLDGSVTIESDGSRLTVSTGR
ncbi:MAG TPA: ComEC/Rec2 family competence protein [Gaiellaceae bacterium]|nr:ComEC/Rec2 family competence protein [Gaiellaceae bacterium]